MLGYMYVIERCYTSMDRCIYLIDKKIKTCHVNLALAVLEIIL